MIIWHSVRLDFEVHWMVSEKAFRDDPFNLTMRLKKKLPYRVYVNNELLDERDFDPFDYYYTAETHFLRIPTGTYHIHVTELTGMVETEIRHFRLNTVEQPGTEFILP